MRIQESDRDYVQAQLDYLCNTPTDILPNWAWNAACGAFEKMWGLPEGFLCVQHFPDMNKRNTSIAFDDLYQKAREAK
jgi:hypothetical protein